MTKNRWMTAMTLFVITFYSALFISNIRASRSPENGPTAVAEKEKIVEKFKAKEEIARRNLLARPALFSALSYFFTSALFLGVFLDGWLLRRLRQGRRWPEGGGLRGSEIGWGGREVLNGFIFLLFTEACFYFVHEAMRSWTGPKDGLPDAWMFVASLLRSLVVAAFVWSILKTQYGQGLRELGLRFEKIAARVWTGCVGYIAVLPPLLLTFVIVAAALKFFSIEIAPQNVVQTYLEDSTNAYLVPLTVFVALLGPVLEELFFRGFAYAGLRKRFGVWGGATISSAAFAALHMNGAAFAPILLLGLFLAYLYESSGSLIPPITAHMLHNGIMVALTLGFKSLSS